MKNTLRTISVGLAVVAVTACAPVVTAPTTMETYTNANYGFSFQYPSALKVREELPQGTAASWDIILLTGDLPNYTDDITVRVYEKKQIGNDLFHEWSNDDLMKNDSLLVQIFGEEKTDAAHLKTVQSTFHFTK